MTDLEWVAGLKGAHTRSLGFYHYLLQKDKKYAPVALGMYIHAITDTYIEPNYVDNEKTVAVADGIIKKYDPTRVTIPFAHHMLVEQAIDYHISSNNRNLVRSLNRALRRFYKPQHLHSITQHMEDFFGVKKEFIQQKLAYFDPDARLALMRVEDFALLPGQVKIWINNMFFRIHEKTFGSMYRITLAARYVWFSYWQDKLQLQRMFEEAKDKLNDFQGIIRGFQMILDENVKEKLGLLYAREEKFKDPQTIAL